MNEEILKEMASKYPEVHVSRAEQTEMIAETLYIISGAIIIALFSVWDFTQSGIRNFSNDNLSVVINF